jgi:methionyl-tRNA formyltransferase
VQSRQYTCALLTCADEHLASSTESYTKTLFDVRHVSRHRRDDTALPAGLTRALASEQVDFLFNFLAPVIYPGEILKKIRRSAINFHPAPPEWPGVGSASFALYEGDKEFGATAHLMTERVDAGEIVRVIRFPIFPEDSCDRLFERSLNYTLILFYEVLAEAYASGTLGRSGETWKRKAGTRKQFENWMTLSPGDSPEEVARKVRALRHSRLPGPFFDLAGFRFELPPRKDGEQSPK